MTHNALVCLICGASNAQTTKFCIECGTRMAVANAAPPIEYGMVSVQRAANRTDEVEALINEMAAHGWEVIGYSAHGWRGVMVEGYSHLILLRRERRRDEGPEFRCFRCGAYCWPEQGKTQGKCRGCGNLMERPLS